MLRISEKLSSLSSLGFDDGIIETLKKNNILNTKELCKTSKKTLKKIGFTVKEVNYIEVKLQLLGLDLSRK